MAESYSHFQRDTTVGTNLFHCTLFLDSRLDQFSGKYPQYTTQVLALIARPQIHRSVCKWKYLS